VSAELRERHRALTEQNQRGLCALPLMAGQIHPHPELRARVSAVLMQAQMILDDPNGDAAAAELILDHCAGMLAAPYRAELDIGPHSTLAPERQRAQMAGFAQGQQLISDVKHERENERVKAADARAAEVESQRAQANARFKVGVLLKQLRQAIADPNYRDSDRAELLEFCAQLRETGDR
jgi:hypothetical protein